MTTGNFAATEGSGKNAATWTFTEDAITKFLQRVGLNGSDGSDIGGAASDPAWTSGNGTLISLLKALVATAQDTTTESPVSPHQPVKFIPFAPTLDTAIYAAGDVLFATAPITNACRANDIPAILQSLVAIDKTKQNPAIDLLFYSSNVTSAAANAANNLSDTDQINLCGRVSIAAADWTTYANNSVLTYSGSKAPNAMLAPASGTTIVYIVGILTAGTPTFALGDLMFKFGMVQG